MKKKLCYIVSDIDKALAFEWVASSLKSDYDLHFMLIGKSSSQLGAFLLQQSVRVTEIEAGNLSIARIWWKVFRILLNEKPTIVHTHLWRATLTGMTASWLLRVPKRIFTRHHATIHHREYPSGQKWDRLCNQLATHIVAISENIKKILIEWDKASPNKIKLIHHGFDLHYFKSVQEQQVATIRRKLAIEPLHFPIIGVISRYTKWKGIQFVVEAFQRLHEKSPNALLILANAHGDYSKTIEAKLQLLPDSAYRQILFESDLAALYQVFDIFVHVPIDENAEAFGQTYVEALAAGVPSVFTLSGVAPEFIRHQTNAWVVPFEDANSIQQAIDNLLTNDELRNSIIENGHKSVLQFSLEGFIQNMRNLYE